jgi:hypothetical protein
MLKARRKRRFIRRSQHHEQTHAGGPTPALGLARDLERLPDVSTTQVEARESWGLAGLQHMSEFVNNYAGFGEFASRINGLRKSA